MPRVQLSAASWRSRARSHARIVAAGIVVALGVTVAGLAAAAPAADTANLGVRIVATTSQINDLDALERLAISTGSTTSVFAPEFSVGMIAFNTGPATASDGVVRLELPAGLRWADTGPFNQCAFTPSSFGLSRRQILDEQGDGQ